MLFQDGLHFLQVELDAVKMAAQLGDSAKNLSRTGIQILVGAVGVGRLILRGRVFWMMHVQLLRFGQMADAP